MSHAHDSAGSSRIWLQGAVVVAAYVTTGRLGLTFDPIGGLATLVWPPAGIGLAAMVVFGRRIWPAIALGACVVNVGAGAPFLLALAIAAGNTLEALIGSRAVEQVPGFDRSLWRRQDVVALVVTAATSTTVGATVGVASMVAVGTIPAESWTTPWFTWWLGDAIGILTVGTAILIWSAPQRISPAGRRGEAGLLVAALAILSWISFRSAPRPGADPRGWPYLLSPLLIWAALRFGQRAASSAILLVSAIAIWGTANGLGPFGDQPLSDRLRALQVFIGVTAVTFLILGAVATERRISERDLRLAKDLAEAANRTKTQFLGVVSHELRTPLTGIIGYADLMDQEIPGPLTPSQREQVGRIKAAAWHLVGMIEGVLNLARLDGDRGSLVLKATDMADLARRVGAEVGLEALRHGMVVAVHAPAEPMSLGTDAGRVRDILLVLLRNAVKFAEKGTIDLELTRQPDGVSFAVRDEGPGIPAADQNRVFTPFTQVDQTNTRTKGGLGVGLATARANARLMGGDLHLSSSSRGCVFTLQLPDLPLPPGS